MPCTFLALALLASPTGAGAQSQLPRGFGGISVGDAWASVQGLYPFQEIGDLSTDWDRLAHDCGYRALAVGAQNGELVVTVNDFVVTDISFSTAIEPGSDLLEVADLVMQSYGQPDSASMRNLYGTVTIDRDRVNFITLAYKGSNQVVFNISGRELWEYQVQVRFEHYKWHENRTLQCARTKSREEGKEEDAPAEASGG